jgi:type III secretory pathway component EscV
LRLEGLNDDAIFKLAVDNLKKIKVVGIQEQLDKFAQAIANAFGVTIDIPKINVTEERMEVTNISVSTLRRIQGWLYMDMELYQEALRRI